MITENQAKQCVQLIVFKTVDHRLNYQDSLYKDFAINDDNNTSLPFLDEINAHHSELKC